MHECAPVQVLIRVHACGVNPVETYIRAGTYGRKPPLPYTPGTDVAGVVDSIGDGVTAVKVGEGIRITAEVDCLLLTTKKIHAPYQSHHDWSLVGHFYTSLHVCTGFILFLCGVWS